MIRGLASLLLAVLSAGPAMAQSLEERLDEEAFLRGLSDLQLPELLEQYIEGRPSDDPVRAVNYRIAAERLRMRDTTTSAEERLQHAERILVLRQTLIDGYPDSLDRGVWLVDQAADLYFELLRIESTELTVLFGLPSAAQRARADRVARELEALTVAAASEIDRAILALESSPGYTADLQRQSRRARLAEEQRDRRIPFLRGIGAGLAARLAERGSPAALDGFRATRRYLEPLLPRLDDTIASRARLYLVLADTGLSQFDSAATLLAERADDLSRREAFAFDMADVENTASRDGATPALRRLEELFGAYDDPGDVLFRVIMADQAFLLTWRRARAAPPGEAASIIAVAYEHHPRWLSDTPGIDSATMRTIVLERLTRAARLAAPPRDGAPLVRLAGARAREQGDEAPDEALAVYADVADDARSTPADRATALFGQGRVLHRLGRTDEAVEQFAILADELPTADEAERAVEVAATLAARRADEVPDDPSVQERLVRVLTILLDRYPNLASIDQWRYLAGRLALRLGDFDEAMTRFGRVPRGADTWVDSQFMMASVQRERLRASGAEARGGAAEGLFREVERADNALRQVQNFESDPERGRKLDYYLAQLRGMRAEALLGQERYQEAAAAARAIVLDGTWPSDVVASALRTEIEALRASDDMAAARGQLARFIELAPDQVGDVVVPMLSTQVAAVRRLRDERKSDAAEQLVNSDLVPLANMLAEWLETRREERTATQQLLAEAYLEAGRYPRALGFYDQLLASHPNALPLLKGRADCLFGIGGDSLGEAMTIYKRIGAMDPASAGDAWWHAQLRMMEILERAGRNTHRIAPYIERLRQRDPELGGERFRSEFDALQRRATK